MSAFEGQRVHQLIEGRPWRRNRMREDMAGKRDPISELGILSLLEAISRFRQSRCMTWN